MTETYLDSKAASSCCGCGACVDICPKNAISMIVGQDKSKYPVIDHEKCVGCNACRKVCPISNIFPKNEFEPKAYACVLNDASMRMKSASGGAFEGLAAALENEYSDLLIAGARWADNLTVHHDLLPASERDVFRKSKYVQSDCTGIYRKVKTALECEKAVLFTGTPCQIAALKSFLGKEYEKLYTVDIVCHGVAGQKILEKYIKDSEAKGKSKIVEIEFRAKKKDLYGEIHSRIIKTTFSSGKVVYKDATADSYLRGFHKGVLYRESCYSCPFANASRNSDVTIGDYWHIQKLYPDLVDYSGVSCVLVNTQKGNKLISLCDSLRLEETSVDFLINHNGQLKRPCEMPACRNSFMEDLNRDDNSFDSLIEKHLGKADYVKKLISALLPGKLKRKIKNKGT